MALAQATTDSTVSAGTPDIHARNQAQGRNVLDRLVGRTVFAETDRIVREDVDRAQIHEGRHAKRISRIVGEGEEGGAVGDEAAVRAQCRSESPTCRILARRS